jgi:hypothetical protein
MNVDFTFEFGQYDGIWWIFGLPVLVILVLVILSPLSFLIHRLISKSTSDQLEL